MRVAIQLPEHRANIGIEMDGKYDLHVAAFRQLRQRRTDVSKSVAEAFPPMAGDKEHLLVWVEECETFPQSAAGGWLAQRPVQHIAQRIDNRVSRYQYVVRIGAFAKQAFPRTFGGGI